MKINRIVIGLLMIVVMCVGCGDDADNVVADENVSVENDVNSDSVEDSEADSVNDEANVAITEDMGTTSEITSRLSEDFKNIIKEDTDLESVAEKLSGSVSDMTGGEMAMVSVAVEPGYLNGFSDEINGFDEGAMFAPMIGTIPFVGYVFKTSDSQALLIELQEKHQMDWNLCTVADSMIATVEGDYVLFVMSPDTF